MPRVDRRSVVLLATVGILSLFGCTAGEATPVPTPTHLALETFPPGEPATNGVEHLAGADVLTEAIAAIDDQPGMSFDLVYRDAAGAETTVAFSGRVGAARAEISTADGTLDLVLGPTVGTASGSGALGASYDLDDSPACRTAADPVFDDWGVFLDPGMLLRTLTARVELLRGGLVDGEPPTVDVILDAGSGTVGTLVVTASGAPLPVRLVLADEAGSAVLDVTGWADAAIEVPDSC
jgi:hypothetical protein